MLNINLKDNEQIILEKTSILTRINHQTPLFDILLTDQRIIFYLHDWEYDDFTGLPTAEVGQKILFKDPYAEVLLDDIIKIDNYNVHFKQGIIEINDNEIIEYLGK